MTNRYFRVSVKSGEEPVRIVADTLEDAQAQANDMAKYFKSKVIQFYEVFPAEMGCKMPKRFTQDFANVFA